MPTAQQEAAANALFQAQRTECQHAIDRAKVYHNYYQRQAQVNAAIQREADRLTAIGHTGRRDESIAGYYGPTL